MKQFGDWEVDEHGIYHSGWDYFIPADRCTDRRGELAETPLHIADNHLFLNIENFISAFNYFIRPTGAFTDEQLEKTYKKARTIVAEEERFKAWSMTNGSRKTDKFEIINARDLLKDWDEFKAQDKPYAL